MKEHYHIELICECYGLDSHFLYTLQENGIIELFHDTKGPHIERDYLPILEKVINLHTELGINLEGIEVILRLLNRLEKMETEINILRAQLHYRST